MEIKIDKIKNIVLLGGGKLLLDLARWAKSEYGIEVLVISSPRHSKEAIESNKTLENILKKENIKFIIVDDIKSKEVKNNTEYLTDTFYLSIGSAWIFSEDIINNLFNGKLFNLHGTRLPQNRGGGGFSWQIMMGNRLGFCQLHLIDGGIDTGNIVKTEEFLYPPACRIPKDYEEIYVKKNWEFVTNFIKDIKESGIVTQTQKQQEYLSSYFPRLNTFEHGWIDWNYYVSELERFICAFDDPYTGAKCLWGNKIVSLKKVSIDFSDQSFHPFQFGIVYRKNKDWLSICANGGTLIVEALRDENNLSLLEEIRIGDKLFTNLSKLDSRNKRVIYTPKGIKN